MGEIRGGGERSGQRGGEKGTLPLPSPLYMPGMQAKRKGKRIQEVAGRK